MSAVSAYSIRASTQHRSHGQLLLPFDSRMTTKWWRVICFNRLIVPFSMCLCICGSGPTIFFPSLATGFARSYLSPPWLRALLAHTFRCEKGGVRGGLISAHFRLLFPNPFSDNSIFFEDFSIIESFFHHFFVSLP